MKYNDFAFVVEQCLVTRDNSWRGACNGVMGLIVRDFGSVILPPAYISPAFNDLNTPIPSFIVIIHFTTTFSSFSFNLRHQFQ